jgi:hypothetical protein
MTDPTPKIIPEPKTPYETPLVEDLNKPQSGEGLIIGCLSGSADAINCATGAGALPN